MQNLVLSLHIIACVLLVALVLLQSGKEGMGVIFGGGSGSLFGSSGAGGVLVKLTAFVAAVFICTSIAYNVVIAKPKSSSVLDRIVPIEDVVPAPSPAPNGVAPIAPSPITPSMVVPPSIAPETQSQGQSNSTSSNTN